jgi:hypothetical protein
MDMEMEKENEGPDKHEIQCWVDCLLKAEEIKADPEKMALIAPEIAAKKALLEKIPVKSMADLKARKNAIDTAPEAEAEGEY